MKFKTKSEENMNTEEVDLEEKSALKEDTNKCSFESMAQSIMCELDLLEVHINALKQIINTFLNVNENDGKK